MSGSPCTSDTRRARLIAGALRAHHVLDALEVSELLQSGAFLTRRGATSGHALGVTDVVGARFVDLSGMGLSGNGKAEVYDWFFHAAAFLFDAILSQHASPCAALLPVNAFVKRRFATLRASWSYL